MPELCTFAEASLSELSLTPFDGKGGGPPPKLASALSEKLQKHLLSLPRVMRSSSTDDKLHVLRLITGYFSLLGGAGDGGSSSGGGSSPLAVLWLTSFDRISFAMLYALRVDTTDVLVLERERPVDQSSSSSSTSSSSSNDENVGGQEGKAERECEGKNVSEGEDGTVFTRSYYETRFTHAPERETRVALISMCVALGRCLEGTSLYPLLDRLLEQLRDAAQHQSRREVML
jgi:hypothetical protein